MKKIVLALILLGLPFETRAEASNDPSLTAFSQSIEDLARRIGTAIVQVEGSDYGSGVILSSDGYIVTNAHVIEGARKLSVTLSHSPDPFPIRLAAEIVGVDKETDLALLKIDKEGLTFLELDDSDEIQQGQIVLAFGSPLGLANSMTMGIVSAARREINENNPVEYIQTDAPINPGNSGGALVDTHGRLLGINTFILSQSGGNEGLGFAIPADVVKVVYDQLRHNGQVRRGMIGAASQNLSEELIEALSLSSRSGAIICDIVPGGPADRAGLQTGDIVMAVDGKTLQRGRELQARVFIAYPGQPIKLDVLRGNSRRLIEVAVEARPEFEAGLEIEPLGVLAADTGKGIVVTGHPAAAVSAPAIDLALGDVIYSLNNVPLKSIADLRGRLAATAPGLAVALQVERNGGFQYVAFRMEQARH